MKTTGSETLDAASRVAAGPGGTGGETVPAAGEPPQAVASLDEKSAPGHRKPRKRRRKRGRPVYAPGTGPKAAAERNGAVAAAETADAAPASGPAPAQPRRDPAQFYGALDLGTNNCRLLVAAPRERGFRVVDAFSRIVRLGEGIGQTGRLGDAAMDRAVEALKVCSSKLAYRGVTRARLIATEACRVAANGTEFIDRVTRETGLVLEIVSQETEAKLAVAGCASLVDPNASGVVLFDIGGGSSELVWIDLSTPREGKRRPMPERVRSWMSLPVGVVNLSERHGGRDVSAEQFEAMVDEVANLLHDFPEVENLDRAVADGAVHMLGTSGTVTTLAGVHLRLPRYDRRRVDGTWLSGRRVAELVAEFAAMDYDTRVANPCIGRERADLVLAGCAILEAFRRRWPVERLRVADRGLREGLLVELMAEDDVWRPRYQGGSGDTVHG
ncbi:Ppx/GppA phosphatase family protein [Bauldia litoralis]|uniref:Exopolyphosphatase / guanosine-5'-triphosphate,3'-diphosphate pyrophosphatase n=1 Tax=Bauldia litoralis TaxID=665467 RepID=A0A1G6DG36_9HYPH|nr:Ppx/GppA phosphatase family protein [Bauldia litoralis]SDB43815.1 exopolyphosphatase / guanosine-5'-triphosphate,3'-diphosphate pyrophosphatase [Bauldia litoralis]